MRLSVRTKLFGSFGVVVGLMLVLGVAAIVELGSVDNRAQYLGTNSVPAAQTIGTIETAAANFRRVQADLVVARAARRPKLMSQLGPYAAEATGALTGYAGSVTDPTDRKLWDTTKMEWASYLRTTAHVEDDVRTGHKAAAAHELDEPARRSISSPGTATPGTPTTSSWPTRPSRRPARPRAPRGRS